MTTLRKTFIERAIHDETGLLIGTIEGQPGVRGFFAHSIHDSRPQGKKAASKTEAAIHIHVLHDNARDCTT